MIDYHPMSPEAKQDPERFFSKLRRECPVHHYVLGQADAERINSNPLAAQPTSEFWSILSYDDVVKVLLSPELFSSKEGPGPERMVAMTEDGMLLWADNPAHLRQRRIAAKAFTPLSVERLLPTIQRLTDEIIDKLAPAGEAELMADFAIPLTIRTVASIMGVDTGRVDDFWRWGTAIVGAFGGDAAALEQGFLAIQELFGYLATEVDERRRILAEGGQPPEDVLTALVTSEYNGSYFSDEEIFWASLQLITAGFETTSSATGNAVVLLCSNPEERRKLESDPSLIDGAVEEILRYRSPLEGLFRTTTADVEVGGCPIPKGAKVRVVWASANRDDTQFSDADRFVVDRDPAELRKHVAFGLGPHACVGAALARAELRIALATLLRRLPDLDLDPDNPPLRNRALTINGYVRVPVRWDPSATQPATFA
jgi:hypothetical protein